MAVFNGTAGNDVYLGSPEHDQIFGIGGNDLLSGGAGNDAIDGGAGGDTFVFLGSRSGYSITRGFSGSINTYTITDVDPVNGDEGTDTIIVGSGDQFRFADFTVSVGVDANWNVAPVPGQPGASNQTIADNRAFNYRCPDMVCPVRGRHTDHGELGMAPL
jgi:hypothetical protein